MPARDDAVLDLVLPRLEIARRSGTTPEEERQDPSREDCQEGQFDDTGILIPEGVHAPTFVAVVVSAFTFSYDRIAPRPNMPRRIGDSSA